MEMVTETMTTVMLTLMLPHCRPQRSNRMDEQWVVNPSTGLPELVTLVRPS